MSALARGEAHTMRPVLKLKPKMLARTAAGIAKPLVNPAIPRSRKIPDFLWSDHDLVLEADSLRYHGNLIARADDADKQAELEALGYTVIRTSWAEMTTRPDRMLARVQRELTRVDPPAALSLRSA